MRQECATWGWRIPPAGPSYTPPGETWPHAASHGWTVLKSYAAGELTWGYPSDVIQSTTERRSSARGVALPAEA